MTAKTAKMSNLHLPSCVDAPDHVTDVRIPVGRRWVLSLYDLGNTFSAYFMTAFLTVFFTNVAFLPLAAIAMLTLVVRIFDAANDPIIGSLLDRGKGRQRYRHWAIIGQCAAGVMAIIMWQANPAWAEGSRLA